MNSNQLIVVLRVLLMDLNVLASIVFVVEVIFQTLVTAPMAFFVLVLVLGFFFNWDQSPPFSFLSGKMHVSVHMDAMDDYLQQRATGNF